MSTTRNLKRALSPAPSGPMIIRLDWSDGKTTWGDGPNGPTEDNMDATPDESGAQNYMRPVPRYSKKEVHWLMKLADELVKEKDPAYGKTFGGRVYFESLPAGYQLFEQVQVPGRDGGKPRTDTYLYGHPKGPRKRFRSPGDFLPHMIWLASDVTKNPENCACRACKGGAAEPRAPEKTVDTPRSTRASSAKAAAPSPRLRSATTPAAAAAATTPPPAAAKKTAPATRRSTSVTASSGGGSSSSSVGGGAGRTQAAPPPPPAIQRPATMTPPAPATQILHQPVDAFVPSEPLVSAAVMLQSSTFAERMRDLQPPDLWIFRLGEQVWVQVNPHWAIGVVTAVPAPGNQAEGYTIQPLHSPFTCESVPPHTNVQPQQIRPWVAWSTPGITAPPLATLDVEYEALPWPSVRTAASLEVDASIVKARAVDASYTLIDRLSAGNDYAGVYYGAEKLWMGDAVRLKASAVQEPGVITGSEILVIVAIRDGAPLAAYHQRCKETGVYIYGDIYRLTFSAHAVPNATSLPVAVSTDIMVRARITGSNPHMQHATYAPIAKGVHVRLEDVKGRWYPTSSLYRVMHGKEAFQSLVKEKRWEESGGKMNEMGNAGNANARGWRRHEYRHEAFTKAVPAGTVFPPQRPLAGVTAGAAGAAAMAAQGAAAHSLAAELHMGQAVDLAQAPPPEDEDAGMEFLEDPHDEDLDDEFVRKMREDATSFLTTEEGDAFYGGL